MIATKGSAMASRTCAADITTVLGSPVIKYLPGISSLGSLGPGYAEPSVTLTSAVRSRASNSFAEGDDRLIELVAADLIDCAVTMPPSEITATSVVPPPM
jgi:hypothetical protein